MTAYLLISLPHRSAVQIVGSFQNGVLAELLLDGQHSRLHFLLPLQFLLFPFLLRLLCGEDVPHTGTVECGSRLQISHVQQDPSGLRGDLSAYAAQHGLDESLFKAILRKLDFARVQFEKDMQSYSAGQRKKVLLAASLCQSAHVFIWDEPLNYIDLLSRIQLEELIKKNRPTMLIVEHDRAFIENIGAEVVGMG